MTKIRRFEINKTDDSYEISVEGGETVSIMDNVISDLNKYHGELDTIDQTISLIMQEIDNVHNLLEDEYREYEQTLKYILKD